MDDQVVVGKASLSGLRRRIRADLSSVGADPSVAFDCLVAVTEACTSALMHIGEGDLTEPRVRWEIDGELARFWIEDFSEQEWSKSVHPSRWQKAEIEEIDARLGDIGIALMQELMDEVEIARSPAGTTVVLTKRLGRSKSLASPSRESPP